MQQRTDLLSINFNVPWANYKAGFGDPRGNFWLGNDRLHQLTGDGGGGAWPCAPRLRVDLQTSDGRSFYATYDQFVVDDETNGYQLHVGGYSGTAGDGLTYYDGMKFTTIDKDEDRATNWNCAVYWHGGFWYNACTGSVRLYELNYIEWYAKYCSQIRMSLELFI